MAVMDFIMEKIREKPDLTSKTTVDFDSGKTTAERDKQVLNVMITIIYIFIFIIIIFYL